MSSGANCQGRHGTVESSALALRPLPPTTTPMTPPPTRAHAALATLCLCMLTQSYLLISVFSYAGFLVVHIVPDATADTAGTASGCLASAFMLGRALTSVSWGRAADTYGRTTVLYCSLSFSAVFTLLFGLSESLPWALVTRFLLGAGNGILSTVKTTVSEIAPTPAVEGRYMSLVIGMWSWGFLFSPALSGFLADPLTQYGGTPPTSTMIGPTTSSTNPSAVDNETYGDRGGGDWWMPQPDTVLYRILFRYPFLLPNIFGALLCGLAIVAVAVFVPETLPENQRRKLLPAWVRRQSPTQKHLPPSSDIEMVHPKVSVKQGALEQTDSVPASSLPSPVSMADVWALPATRAILLIYWCNSFVVLCNDETFPLFSMSPRNLGWKEFQIGQILSLCGLLFAVTQYYTYAAVQERYGLVGTLQRGATLAAPLPVLVPLALYLESWCPITEWLVPLYLAFVLAIHKMASLLFFASISVAINRSVPPHLMATANGLSMLGGSLAKAAGPLVAGFLSSVALPHPGGAWVVYGVLTFGGSGVALMCWKYWPKTRDADSGRHVTYKQVSLTEDSFTSVEDDSDDSCAGDT